MADTIKLGNLDISSFKVGSADCSVYLGTVKLYPNGGNKLTVYSSLGETETLICDGSSYLSSGETRSITLDRSTITAATVGECVTQLNPYTFGGRTETYSAYRYIETITFLSTIPPTLYDETTRNNFFPNLTSLTAIYVPAESVNDYKTANFWSENANIIQAIPNS